MQQHLAVDGNVLGVCATVREAKDLVSSLEIAVVARAKGFNSPAELDSQSLGRLRREGVIAKTLDLVHAVDAKGLDLDQGFTFTRRGLWRVGIDEKVLLGTFAVLDVCFWYL